MNYGLANGLESGDEINPSAAMGLIPLFLVLDAKLNLTLNLYNETL